MATHNGVGHRSSRTLVGLLSSRHLARADAAVGGRLRTFAKEFAVADPAQLMLAAATPNGQKGLMIAVEKAKRRGGRPKSDELAERTEDLLAVTQALLVRVGYERMTINLIAQEASISKKTIYSKFGDKLGLLREVLHRMSDQSLSDELSEDDSLPLYEGLLRRMLRIIRSLRSDNAVGLVAVSIREVAKFPEIRDMMIKSREDSLLNPLTQYLENLKMRGLVKDVDCRRIASNIIWSLSFELIDSFAMGQEHEEDEEALQERAAFMAGLYRDAITA